MNILCVSGSGPLGEPVPRRGGVGWEPERVTKQSHCAGTWDVGTGAGTARNSEKQSLQLLCCPSNHLPRRGPRPPSCDTEDLTACSGLSLLKQVRGCVGGGAAPQPCILLGAPLELPSCLLP